MTNATAMLNYMISGYDKLAGAHEYIWGFTQNGASALPYVCKLDKASRGAGYALRFKPTVAQKLFLMTSASVLCSEKFFNETVAHSKYNKGEIFEKMVTEKFGQVWTKNSIPFTECGDININGIEYQIKYQLIKTKEIKNMYMVMIGGTSYTVYGMEVAYEAYEKAVEFADTIGLIADLVDGETGEVLASNRWE